MIEALHTRKEESDVVWLLAYWHVNWGESALVASDLSYCG